MSEEKVVLELHGGARTRFDSLGTSIRGAIRAAPPPPSSPVPGWMPDVHAKQVSAKDIVGPVRRTIPRTDGSCVYQLGGLSLELSAEQVEEFDKLCDGLHRAILPKNSVSSEAVRNSAKDWLISGDAEGVSDYCLSRLRARTTHYLVWIPVAGLHVEQAFRVGRVTFQELSGAKIHEWHHSDGYDALPPDEKLHVDAYYERFREDHRGLAVGIVEVFGEEGQARAIALDLVEDALAMLRFFSGAALIPSMRSLCLPHGRERKEGYVVVFEDGGKFAGEHRGILDGETARPWAIRADELVELRRGGLDRLSELLTKIDRTEFEQRILSAVKLYGDATLETRSHIKLVLMLGALEGVFLGNSQEPIQQNLGERLARVTEHEFEKRVAVPKMVREVYSLRSRFVHHAEEVENEQLLLTFFHTAWVGMVAAIENSSRFGRVRDFTDAIDAEKFR